MKPVASLPCDTVQLHRFTRSFILARMMLHIRQHQLREFLFAIFFFLPDTDTIMTLLRYLFCYITTTTSFF